LIILTDLSSCHPEDVLESSHLKCHPEPACRQAGLVQNLFARNVLAILRQAALLVAIFNLARTFLAMGRAGRPGAGYVYPSRTLIRLRRIAGSNRQLLLTQEVYDHLVAVVNFLVGDAG
jgi:hypothetical protein